MYRWDITLMVDLPDGESPEVWVGKLLQKVDTKDLAYVMVMPGAKPKPKRKRRPAGG